ncbi:MAG TPA: metalloregulator ArsR/SmtB family transcription factor [Candidatus Dormibacteraeota bacterium]|nr:metalloregulator ArsR/SmtB family transcription factor [Candidatus Dormibacteraeota bacterium]
MPMQLQEVTGGDIAIRPSAVFELMWLFHVCESDDPVHQRFAGQEALRQRLGDAINTFWQDGVHGFTEVVVLGKRSGTLFDLDLERFFARLDETARGAWPRPSLLSEPVQEQEPLRARLTRLRSDLRLRRKYVELLRDVWAAVEQEWRETGRAEVTTEVARWARRLRDGDSYLEILGRTRLWKGRPELDAMANAAAAEGGLVLSPGWFYGEIHIVELDGDVYLGRGVHLMANDAEVRKVAAEVASSVKALADPTRVSILLSLAVTPASVTEIARHFNLSQPTISAHVQVLREARLIDETPSGRSSKLRASEEGLRRLLSGAQESMVQMFRDR